MTAFLFLALLILVTGSLVAAAFLYLPIRVAVYLTAAIAMWIAYVGALSASGMIADITLRPAGIAYILLPVFAFMILVTVRSRAALQIALLMPLPLLIGAQFFRVGVELEFHRLWIDGLVPKMLTFEGANVDIAIGASAPFAAWISTLGRRGQQAALIWNAIGLVALANIAVRAALTAPGPFNLMHLEVPNLAFGTFPFTYIPGFFAPLAATLQILAIRSILFELKQKLPRSRPRALTSC